MLRAEIAELEALLDIPNGCNRRHFIVAVHMIALGCLCFHVIFIVFSGVSVARGSSIIDTEFVDNYAVLKIYAKTQDICSSGVQHWCLLSLDPDYPSCSLELHICASATSCSIAVYIYC